MLDQVKSVNLSINTFSRISLSIKVNKVLMFFILLNQINVLYSQQPEKPANGAAEKPRQQREIKWVNPDFKPFPGLSHHILQSKSLGHEVGYVVWTPDGYAEKAHKRYPVVYFLHGAGGNESADAAGFSSILAKAIEEKIIPPVICVLPNGGMSGYRGEVEKMIIEELIPVMDKDYKTIAKPKSRALAGFSMGGAGSVYLSIMHPEMFCAAGSMGGGIGSRPAKNESANELKGFIDKALPVWKKNHFGFFLANGDNDRPEAFADFTKILEKEGIEHEVVILPDTKHNLGHYYERSGSNLLTLLGKHLKK